MGIFVLVLRPCPFPPFERQGLQGSGLQGSGLQGSGLQGPLGRQGFQGAPTQACASVRTCLSAG
eukprot:889090-Pyramimonas_sp.AAC.1